MKNEKPTYKPVRIVDGYQMRKHFHEGFKIVEYFHFSNDATIRKKVLYKHLTLSDAEDKLYRLESRLK